MSRRSMALVACVDWTREAIQVSLIPLLNPTHGKCLYSRFPIALSCRTDLFLMPVVICHSLFNPLAPGIFECHFRYLIFQIISVIDGWVISWELALRWMSLDLTDDKSTLVQVMAWCRQATSHYLRQWWPRSLSPYGVARPQWVSTLCCMHR